MRERWTAVFVARLTASSLLRLNEAIEVAARVYPQASRLSPEAAADYVLQSGLIRRLDRLGPHAADATDAAGMPAARNPVIEREGIAAAGACDERRRRDDGPERPPLPTRDPGPA